MKLGGWNGRGMGNMSAVRGVKGLLRKEDPDILFLYQKKLDKKGIENFAILLECLMWFLRRVMGEVGD
jgi:hypothetical protein